MEPPAIYRHISHANCHSFIVPHIKTIFLFELNDIPLYLDSILISSMHHGRHLYCFYLLAVVNNDIVNMGSQTPAFCYLGYTLKNGVVGSCLLYLF